MAKKRKLNSRNPKYNSEVKDTISNVLRRVLLCMVTPSNPYRKVVQKPIPVYGVWLK
tara:strand:+ start:920 stop:1090 length:171 start_codon:yes stop_codon:yes gene_type:complete